jgi:hypothetical protein
MDAMVRELFDAVASYFWISLKFVEDHNTVIVAIGTLALAVFTWSLWRATLGMLRVASEQSADMKRSIAESSRASCAMEEVAKHMAVSAKAAIDSVVAVRERTAQQMRAYISVLVGRGFYQERGRNIKFEAQPVMLNSGHTPAYRVSYRAKAAILPVPLPDNFTFPRPESADTGAVLGAQQNFIMNAVVDSFCGDAEVETIKGGNGKALYVWGIVTYDDIDGVNRETKFCQCITWLPNGQIHGYHLHRHTNAT